MVGGDQFSAIMGRRRGGGHPDSPLGADDWVLSLALAARDAQGRRLSSVFCADSQTSGSGTVLMWHGSPIGFLDKFGSPYLVPMRELEGYDDAEDLGLVCEHIKAVMEEHGKAVGFTSPSTCTSHLRGAGIVF